jgi:glutamate-1-semialdehyde 2,1-aminomutase
MNSILAEYQARTSRSAALMRRSFDVIAGGVSRNFGFHIPYPVVNEEGHGARIVDVDGNEYIDFVYNGMSLIHGHAFPPVVEEIRAVIVDGWAWQGTNLPQIEYGELLCRRLRSVERVRFTNSGSEATMLAVKVARRHTGRMLILKANAAYHGTYPDLEAGLHGTGDIEGRTVARPFGDTEAFIEAMRTHDFAAVVIEPVLITGGCVPPPPGFLKAVQDFARERGILVVMDDCLMFRLAPGGSAEFFDLAPDLIVLGKFLGGGIPMGAVLGPAGIMGVFSDSARPLYHGGSFNGNALASRAGLATMQALTREAIDGMNARAAHLRTSIDGTISRLGLPAETTSVGSTVGVTFKADGLSKQDYYADYTIDLDFHLACLLEGLQPGAGGFFSFSTAIDDAILAEAEDRIERALVRVAVQHAN